MREIEQGDILRVERGKAPFLVISSDLFNRAGLAVICPILTDAKEDALHVRINTDRFSGVVLCEELAAMSVKKRSYAVIDHVKAADLLEIIYRVQSIFDYFPHAE